MHRSVLHIPSGKDVHKTHDLQYMYTYSKYVCASIWHVACHHVCQQRTCNSKRLVYTVYNCVKHSGSNVNFTLNNNHFDFIQMLECCTSRPRSVAKSFGIHSPQAYTVHTHREHIGMCNPIDGGWCSSHCNTHINANNSPQVLPILAGLTDLCMRFFFLFPFIGVCPTRNRIEYTMYSKSKFTQELEFRLTHSAFPLNHSRLNIN